MPQELVPLAEAANKTGYNIRTMRQYCNDGTIKTVKVSNKWFVYPDDVERLRIRKTQKESIELGCWNKSARELAREAKTRNWTPTSIQKAYLAGEFAQERSGCITMASEDTAVLKIVRRAFGQDVSPAHAGLVEPTDGTRFAMVCDPNNPRNARFKRIEETA